MSIIVYGPPAGGMAEHGQALQALFGCATVGRDTSPADTSTFFHAFFSKRHGGRMKAQNALFFTDAPLPAALEKLAASSRRVYSWDEAMAKLKGAAARAEG